MKTQISVSFRLNSSHLVDDNGETMWNNTYLPFNDSDIETEYVEEAFSLVGQSVEHVKCTGVETQIINHSAHFASEAVKRHNVSIYISY